MRTPKHRDGTSSKFRLTKDFGSQSLIDIDKRNVKSFVYLRKFMFGFWGEYYSGGVVD